MENCTESVRQFTLRIGGPPANLEESLEVGIEGVVIATPSAPHAQQAAAAPGCGVAVFCQKTLCHTAAAHAVNRLLGGDFPDTDAHRAGQLQKVLDGNLREVTV